MYLKKFLQRGIFSKFQHKRFSIKDWILDTNRSTLAYRMTKYDPRKEVDALKPNVIEETKPEYSITKLQNGMTVVTESNDAPSNVHMGVLINVGTRDENHENSGSCLAIKNTYLKTLKHTNETINYGMIQMSGGECHMSYDEETMFYHAYSFEYDVTDIFRMLGDMAFEPRSILAANVAREKNRQHFKLNHHLHHYNPFQNNPQLLLTTAYGYNGLGMPKDGFESNIENLDSKILQEFQLENITPEKVTIVANGVKNHREFVDIVQDTLGVLAPVREADYQRPKSEYIGGEYRVFTETPDTNIILAYQSVPWTDKDMPVFALLQTIFGSATGFSVGGPGKGMYNRAHRNILQRYGFIHDCECVNLAFSDSGLFGLNFTGRSTHSKEILDVMLQEFENFRRPIDEVELNRAKNMIKRNILINLSNQGDRLEELAKSFNTFQDVNFLKYIEWIDSVTTQQINEAVSRLISGRPTMVVTGSAVNLVPSISDIQKKLSA